ncbi:hypothetical protein Y017_11365 [Alcanivorax sp. 97CO-5]|uniref:DUF262 domain-containing protein n=1 Tax=unclassified Alcanivorax TaxID=2638842 RepID=UPI0003E8032C|nr:MULTISPECIES: DUF262 domain-containing protein [unclassified Alcanivorax]EUC70013.1 hypothetical protein Y017_11365 [Alcanivorax sp. 97CO-5]
MTVQVATCSAAQLFSGCLLPGHSPALDAIVTSDGATVTGELTIPEYQRPYCWQDTQLHGLLLDIESHVVRKADGDIELPYYLGSLILHQEAGKLNIIDGQQRITTLALMACLLDPGLPLVEGLVYEHPTSQQQIKHNLKWLRDRLDRVRNWIDFNNLQFTLVITQSEDDAYRFFETQNTGGVRLGGPDIIKAHHLRAVDKLHQPQFARQWEALGSLDSTVSALLKGRYWQGVKPRELPPHNQQKRIRDCIVDELAQDTGEGDDIAYGRIRRQIGLAGDVSQQADQQGYEVRQPLNAGVNSIRYLAYFQALHQRYWDQPELPHLPGYQQFVEWLKDLDGCSYLEKLYEACLLLYISQFGENQLELAAKKLFRVVYSRRVSNQKSVRENSIPAFIREQPVLDWIAASYTPEQCFAFLDAFELTVDPSNLGTNSVKQRFVEAVSDQFGLGLNTGEYEKGFAPALNRKIAGEQR